MFTGLGLLYTTFITPFEVGLDLPTKVDALFVCNQLIALLFISDIVIQFFLPTPDPNREDGAHERRHAKLAARYMKGWLLLDLLTVIPFDVLVLIGTVDKTMKATKLLRVMRLIKLLKVLKGSTIIERWRSSVAISSTRLTLLTYSLVTIVLLHWFSCAWCLLGVLQSSQRGESGSSTRERLFTALEPRLLNGFTASGGVCTACLDDDPTTKDICDVPCLTPCEMEALSEALSLSMSYVFKHESWMCRAISDGHFKPEAILPGHSPLSVYVTSLLVAMLQMAGGVSTVLPMNVPEFAWFFVTVLAGTVLFAAVQGVICGIVTVGTRQIWTLSAAAATAAARASWQRCAGAASSSDRDHPRCTALALIAHGR
jgi:hypothetical protein